MKKITKEEFVSRAVSVHGNKYDYSKSIYIDYDTKLEIICKKHGSFWQTPGNHLKGKGCPYCNGNAKMNTKSFIERAICVWGNRFDYSKVKYVNNSTKVCIIDKDGKEYWQTPANHLFGFDCSKNKYNRDKFIEEAKKVHGEKYCYDKVNFLTVNSKVCIICPEHGEFWQTPSNHVRGKGCPKCAVSKVHLKQKDTNESFIRKAKKVHGEKYDYAKVNYKNSREKVCIICPEHGEFYQVPNSHLAGHGCPKCSGGCQLTTEDFLKKAKNIHGDKYDYSKTIYSDIHKKVCIICKTHGEFWMLPGNHIKGQGCPECGRRFRKGETELYEFLCKKYPEFEIKRSFWLKHKEYDIFFPQFKIGIEFQGAQHFIPVDFGGYGQEKAKELFVENQKRDKKKKEFSKKKDITLLYFSDLVEYDTFLGEKLYHDKEELCEVINQIVKKEDEK